MIIERPSFWFSRQFLVLAGMGLVACSDNTPSTSTAAPSSQGGSDPRCSDLLYEVPASCRVCEQQECCPAIMRCQGSSDCEALHSCVAACPPSRRQECEDRCGQTESDVTKGLYYTMRTCLDSAVRCIDLCVVDAGPDAVADASNDGLADAADSSAATDGASAP
jgi:hypothetical protein